MMVGKTYKIVSPTMALDLQDPRRAITLPTGSVIEVVSELGGEGHRLMVDATWEGRTIRMFAADVRARGEEL